MAHHAAFIPYFKLLIMLSISGLLVYVIVDVFGSQQAGGQTVAKMEIMILFTKAKANPGLQSKFRECLSSMLRFNTRPIQLSVIGDGESQGIAMDIFHRLPEKHQELVTFEGLDMEPLAKGVTDLLSPIIKFFRHSPSSYYGDNLFFISIVMFRLFLGRNRVILLDADLSFREDIAQLWRQYDQFTATEVIGIAREMQPVYRHIFHQYRLEQETAIVDGKTKVGEPPPDGITGFNSGDPKFSSLLDPVVIEQLVSKYHFKGGHLGDQDLYTLLSIDHPELFHTLDCGWNRQLCTWWRDKGYEKVFDQYYECNEPIKIYHGNCNTPIPKD